MKPIEDFRPLGLLGLAGDRSVKIEGLTPTVEDPAALAEAWLRLMLRLAGLAALLNFDRGGGLVFRRIGRQVPNAVHGAPPAAVPTGWMLIGSVHEARFEGPKFAALSDTVEALDAAEAEIMARMPAG